MQRLSIQPMQQAVRRAALRPQLLPQRFALLSTSARRPGDTNKTTSSPSPAGPSQKSPGSGQEPGNGNPKLPAFSLDGLGLGKNMKMFLIVMLCIFGTMETWFYCKAIWRWWYGDPSAAAPATAEGKE